MKKLDVFISSDIDEFKNNRVELAKSINRIRFLKAVPLEKRGADMDNVVDASLKAVRSCDIYLGVFGKNYSEITAKEYREAVKNRKPCLTCVKNSKKRDEVLADFIEKELAPQFKYHKFKRNKDLLQQAKTDFDTLLLRILTEGLQAIQQSKKEARIIEEQASESIKSTNLQAVPPANSFQKLLAEASDAFEKEDYMKTVIVSSVALELALRKILKKFKPDIPRQETWSWGQLSRHLVELQALEHSDVAQLNEIQYLRNATLHEGKIPTKASAQFVIETTKKLTERLSS